MKIGILNRVGTEVCISAVSIVEEETAREKWDISASVSRNNHRSPTSINYAGILTGMRATKRYVGYPRIPVASGSIGICLKSNINCTWESNMFIRLFSLLKKIVQFLQFLQSNRFLFSCQQKNWQPCKFFIGVQILYDIIAILLPDDEQRSFLILLCNFCIV